VPGRCWRHGLARSLLLALSLPLALLPSVAARAADPQPYKVEVTSSDSKLDSTLKATSELVTLRETAPVGPFGLIGRARSDMERLKTVLESFGFYQGTVAITINAMALTDPTLGEALNEFPVGKDAQVKVTCTTGTLYRLRRIDIEGEVPKAAAEALGLKSGDPAVAADVLAAGERMQSKLQDNGYAFAKVDTPVAYEDPSAQALDVKFHVVTGPVLKIGKIQFRGLRRTNEAFLQKRLLLRTGEQYSASNIEKARTDLLGLGIFTTVSVTSGTAADPDGGVPVTFRARERKQHAVSISGAYSSDLGGSTGVSWTNRNTRGEADPLTLSASVINLGGSATTGVGYDVSANYGLPQLGRRDQTLQLGAGALKQYLKAYDQTAATVSATVNRKLSTIWTASLGVRAEQEHITQESISQTSTDPACSAPNPTLAPALTQKCTSNYTLLSVPIGLMYDTTNLTSPLEDPRHGMRASFNLTPTLSLGHPNAKFLISQATAAIYFDLNDLGLSRTPGRSVLALRGLAGLAQGAGQVSLPPDQRFYAGGSGTVRGYRYQSVGPTFFDGNPVGGTAVNAGTAEFRQRIGTNFGAVVFVDAGQVSNNTNPFEGTLRFGTGTGFRYYTPIGPIRLDIAIPLERRRGDDPFEVYIGLGQAF
jgi:translocation and assembly module TamA